ncbi:hypothetical protein D8674_037543 [Pyrus ussuriensis x Pyrus communis]|uniref:Uncharacterized protein n=1 Tax=Pyrus ussuriensis x Pyrus communis TaxID=2448454 RepID=A0A5N5GG75_9ROSA|nr:hypothetical protein D8674_037543 [Pyrus ussuriensis x Pyrus communis]
MRPLSSCYGGEEHMALQLPPETLIKDVTTPENNSMNNETALCSDGGGVWGVFWVRGFTGRVVVVPCPRGGLVPRKTDKKRGRVTGYHNLTLSCRHGKVIQGMGKARVCETGASSSRPTTGHVIALTEEVAPLKDGIAPYEAQIAALEA